MANRRMFSLNIVNSDAFLLMPLSSQALYFHLGMRADDDGIVNQPLTILRLIGATNEDLENLIKKKFIIPFEDYGVVVIKGWWIHNTKRKDTYRETSYKEVLEQLVIEENKSYKRIVNDPLPKDNISKDKLIDISRYNQIKANSPFAKTLTIELIQSNYIDSNDIQIPDYISYFDELLLIHELKDIRIKLDYFIKQVTTLNYDEETETCFRKIDDSLKIDNKFLYFKSSLNNSFERKIDYDK